MGGDRSSGGEGGAGQGEAGPAVNPGQWLKLNYASIEGGICEVFGE